MPQRVHGHQGRSGGYLITVTTTSTSSSAELSSPAAATPAPTVADIKALWAEHQRLDAIADKAWLAWRALAHLPLRERAEAGRAVTETRRASMEAWERIIAAIGLEAAVNRGLQEKADRLALQCVIAHQTRDYVADRLAAERERAVVEKKTARKQHQVAMAELIDLVGREEAFRMVRALRANANRPIEPL